MAVRGDLCDARTRRTTSLQLNLRCANLVRRSRSESLPCYTLPLPIDKTRAALAGQKRRSEGRRPQWRESAPPSGFVCTENAQGNKETSPNVRN